jgi:hypothetical protein
MEKIMKAKESMKARELFSFTPVSTLTAQKSLRINPIYQSQENVYYDDVIRLIDKKGVGATSAWLKNIGMGQMDVLKLLCKINTAYQVNENISDVQINANWKKSREICEFLAETYEGTISPMRAKINPIYLDSQAESNLMKNVFINLAEMYTKGLGGPADVAKATELRNREASFAPTPAETTKFALFKEQNQALVKPVDELDKNKNQPK